MIVNTNMEESMVSLCSLYEQYVDWGVGLVKHDCIFGEDLNIDKIFTVSKILRELRTTNFVLHFVDTKL
ncbi:hypothetical protein SUGI_1080930 [Cryptomeria japonica]|nr:hypothetical protein SUGI_1080930 [Cryptomeria japonica]